MLLIFIQVLTVLVPVAVSVPTVYDQRQSGNSNVRIDVRDAVLIAIADEFGDYDYTYDYSDLTIKPEEASPATTSKPVTVHSTVQPSSPVTTETSSVKPMTVESTPSSLKENASIIIDNSTLTFVAKPSGNETSEPEEVALVHSRPPSPLINQDYQIPVIVLHDVKENMKLLPVKIVEKSATAVRGNLTEGLPQPRHCSPGFFLDSYNRCKRIRKPLRENVHFGDKVDVWGQEMQVGKGWIPVRKVDSRMEDYRAVERIEKITGNDELTDVKSYG